MHDDVQRNRLIADAEAGARKPQPPRVPVVRCIGTSGNGHQGETLGGGGIERCDRLSPSGIPVRDLPGIEAVMRTREPSSCLEPLEQASLPEENLSAISVKEYGPKKIFRDLVWQQSCAARGHAGCRSVTYNRL